MIAKGDEGEKEPFIVMKKLGIALDKLLGQVGSSITYQSIMKLGIQLVINKYLLYLIGS